jgi:hypothetical protein
MAKEQFFHPETAELLTTLDKAARRSGVSRGQAFEDFLHMAVCALSGGRMEEQYLAVVQKHTDGKPGRRGVDSLAALYGQAVAAMEQTRDEMKDVLGDLFQGAITYGEHGQFLTPEHLCRAMARLTVGDIPEAEAREQKSVCDPASGSGRMLLAVAEMQPHWLFVGQDVDLRCVRLTAINLALRNLYGYVIWGNSFSNERRLVYRTGFDRTGFISEVPIGECPKPVQNLAVEPERSPPETAECEAPADFETDNRELIQQRRTNQLRLF